MDKVMLWAACWLWLSFRMHTRLEGIALTAKLQVWWGNPPWRKTDSPSLVEGGWLVLGIREEGATELKC